MSTPATTTEETSKPATTTVDLVIRLQIPGTSAEVANYLSALQSLASVMATQAEDGLWSLGHEHGENDDGPSEYIADIDVAHEQAVLVDGKPIWTADDEDEEETP